MSGRLVILRNLLILTGYRPDEVEAMTLDEAMAAYRKTDDGR